MSSTTQIAFLWHMHQPGYLNLEESGLELPWVRLHSAKSYFDMAWLLERHPRIQCTINFVPILFEQISHYLNGMRDDYFHLTMKATGLLTDNDKSVMLAKFFSCHFDTCIATRPRYLELYNKAKKDNQTINVWTDQDFRDLSVLFNLSWFGYGARVEFPLIEMLEAKGQNFNEDEKRKVLDIQLAAMRRLYPMYRRLRARGQVEISTTPYHHPILPLLIDSECMQRCMPDAARPAPFQFPQDARRHVELAMDNYEAIFDERPVGIWPAEGSVSPEAIELFASEGLKWVVTDEAQLWKSLGASATSRSQLYRPYRLKPEGVSLFFRDRDLSDAVGFRYARMNTDEAVQSCVNQIKDARSENDVAPPLVVIALDGENPWEYYPNNGRDFLETLYSRIESDTSLETIRLQDACSEFREPTLDALATGSWIDGNFGVWIGGETENRAWTLLGNARRTFRDVRDALDEATEARTERMLMRAQSSDWFWWYGDRFESADDADFDNLFRSLLKGAYLAMGCEVPAAVDIPLVVTESTLAVRQPLGFLTPNFKLPSTTPVSWADAGVFTPKAGSMALGERRFGEVRFGFDKQNLFFRIERRVELETEGPHTVEIIDDLGPIIVLPIAKAGTIPNEASFARVADGSIEGFVGLDSMERTFQESVTLSFQISLSGEISERLPLQGSITINVPDNKFASDNWSV